MFAGGVGVAGTTAAVSSVLIVGGTLQALVASDCSTGSAIIVAAAGVGPPPLAGVGGSRLDPQRGRVIGELGHRAL